MKDYNILNISLNEFCEITNWFNDFEKYLWNNGDLRHLCKYFAFTRDKLIYLVYTPKINRGLYGCIDRTNPVVEKLEYIYVANRDGFSEYNLLDNKILELEEKYEKIKKRKSKHQEKRLLETSKKIEQLKKTLDTLKRLLPPYEKGKIKKQFNDYIINSSASKVDFAKEYVVIDIETNGLKSNTDDILSLSIYDPFSGKIYNRFLPLDLQPIVFTTHINGIVAENLEEALHITQLEFDEIVRAFNLKERTILAYSGYAGRSKEVFDLRFLKKYCSRHKIKGINELNFKNIKDLVPDVNYELNGKLTKDNLCNLFGISGVTKQHSSINDCILEWQLFEKLYKKDILFIGNKAYEYNNRYIIPVSYLLNNNTLKQLSGIEFPYLIGNPKLIYEYKFPKKELAKIKKFPTNITGIAIENMVKYLLEAKQQDNMAFLVENKKNLKYIGEIESNMVEIAVGLGKDGLLKAVDDEYKDYIEDINVVTETIKSNIKPVIDFIKKNIFNDGDDIIGQELVMAENKKVFALCDFSSNKKVLELKTNDVLDDDGKISGKITDQLYVQAKGRETFLMSVVFENEDVLVKELNIYIYKVDIQEVA